MPILIKKKNIAAFNVITLYMQILLKDNRMERGCVDRY